MSFFTNNENMLPTSLANKAYGDNQELQREYPAGEPLNYYGNEADDLHCMVTQRNLTVVKSQLQSQNQLLNQSQNQLLNQSQLQSQNQLLNHKNLNNFKSKEI